MPTKSFEPDKLQRFLDDLARLSARHGVIQKGFITAAASPSGFGGYSADPTGERLESWRVGSLPMQESLLVSVDVSPEGTERRAREWREEHADAIAAYDNSSGQN